MIFEIENIRRVTRATVPVGEDGAGGITLIMGPNTAGKTSLALAMAAALSSTAQVMSGIKLHDKKSMLSAGCKRGSVQVQDEDGSTRITYPEMEVASTGSPPRGSLMGCGVGRFTLLKPDVRQQTFSRVFQAIPTLSEMTAALEKAGLAEALIEAAEKGKTQRSKIMPVVLENAGDGWDACHKVAAAEARRLKAAWSGATGAEWGEKKAESFVPPELADVEKLSTARACGDRLYVALVEAKATRDRIVGKGAVSAERRVQLQALADQQEGLKSALDTAQAAADEAFKLAEEARDAIPKPMEVADFACPDCSVVSKVEIRGGKLFKLESKPISEGKFKELRMHQAAADGAAGRLNGELQTATNKHAQAVDAAKQLRTMPEATSDEDALADATAAHDTALKRHEVWKAWVRAKQIDNDIRSWLKAADVLAPDGFRREHGTAALGKLNKRLAGLSGLFGCPPIKLSADMEAMIGDLLYVDARGSDAWRIDTALQIEFARAEKHDCIVIDGADVIVSWVDRANLLAVLKAVKLKAVVLIAIPKGWRSDPKRTPDLAEKGEGISLWIEDGVVQPLRAVGERA